MADRHDPQPAADDPSRRPAGPTSSIAKAMRLAADPWAVQETPSALAEALSVLADVIKELRERHRPERGHGGQLVCAGCHLDSTGEQYEWPCADAQLLGQPSAELVVRWDG